MSSSDRNVPAAAVTLFGATGYTGRLVAQVLEREGVDYRIAGRSAERLERLSLELPSRPAWLVADAEIPSTLSALLSGTRVLINCVGPFTDLGERVVARAAMSGVQYLDTTNELGYVLSARGYDTVARKTGAVITPSCAFEVALADCAAHLAAERLGYSEQTAASAPMDEIDVIYAVKSRASHGTRRSAIRTLATSWIAYRGGVWVGQVPGGEVRRFDLHGSPLWGISLPSGESLTVPLHVRTQRVNTWFGTSEAGRKLGPVLVPFAARLSRSILRGLILRAVESGGLTPEGRAGESPTPFTVLARARCGTQTSTVILRGEDPYGVTAEIIAYAASRLIERKNEHGGFYAPAQILNPRAFLDHARASWNITVEEAGPFPT